MTTKYGLLCSVAVCTLVVSGHASAQTAPQINTQMQQLQQQIQQLQQQLQSLQTQVSTQATQQRQVQAAPAAAAAAAPAPHVTQSAANRFSLESADGQYSIGLTGQLHFDAGGYAYHPDGPATVPHDLNSGVNARRARLGLVGKFAGDWLYTFVYDFGGSTDSGTGGINAGGVEKAYVTYNGLNKGPVPLAFDLGYQDVPFTLDEATSSNDLMFMERASSQVIAANIAAGDFRSAFGVRSNDSRYWAGVYVTGPTAGSNHSNTVAPTNGNGEPLGAFGRATYQVLQDPDYSLHVGVDVEGLMKPAASGGVRNLTLSDRPELRIDPTTTSLLTAAFGTATNPLNNASAFGAEVAGGFQNLFVQGEGYNYRISRQGLPENTFWGGYLEGSWTITGEHRNYLPAAGAYSGIIPANPFSLSTGQWGAFELAGRMSYINLNDNFMAKAATPGANSVEGGRQTIYTLGLNWYLNPNIRFMFDYLHGVVKKENAAGAQAGASFDALAMRTQVGF